MNWRQSNNQWSGGTAAHPAPKKFRLQKNSAGKVLASIFSDQNSVLFIDSLPKSQTISAEFYLCLLVKLKDILKEKRRGNFTKGVLFVQDNTPANGTLATQKKLVYLAFQCLDHPPHSPDLAPSDYYLFPGLKKTIQRSSFFVRRGCHCCHVNLVGRTIF